MAKSTITTVLQVEGRDYDISNISAQVRKLVKKNHKGVSIDTCQVYVKAEEATVYYVLNGEIKGRCSLADLA